LARIHKVMLRRARLVLGWVTVFSQQSYPRDSFRNPEPAILTRATRVNNKTAERNLATGRLARRNQSSEKSNWNAGWQVSGKSQHHLPQQCPSRGWIWISMVPGAHKSRQPKPAHDRFSRFCTVHGCAQHTDTQTTLRATSISAGRL